MISMTGFGRAQRRGRCGTVVAELKSVNHRYLEVSCRLPEGLAALEEVVRPLVQRHAQRGKVTVNVNIQGRPATTVAVNPTAARQYVAALRSLQRQLHLPGAVTIDQVAGWPGVLSTSTADAVAAWRPLVTQAVSAAAGQLVRTRRREGQALARALRQIVQDLTRATTALAARAPRVVAEYRTRLEERIRSLTTQPLDPGRLEQEVAFFVKECDIAEELTRINAHVAHLAALMKSAGPVGRTVDFVAQELQREVNTVGSKANDVEVAQLAIRMKGWVEQLREQAQNLE